MSRLLFILPLICFFATEISADESLRCGSKIVTIGMSIAEVLKFCGEPTSKEVEEHDVLSGGRVVGKTQLIRWTYERGYTGKPKVLEFDQDMLLTIN